MSSVFDLLGKVSINHSIGGKTYPDDRHAIFRDGKNRTIDVNLIVLKNGLSI